MHSGLTSQNISFLRDITMYNTLTGSSTVSKLDEKGKTDILILNFMIQNRQKGFYRKLPVSLEFDLSSSVQPHFGVENKTFLKSGIEDKDMALYRTSKILDMLVADKADFKKVDKTKMLQFISNLIKKWSPDKLSSITDDELRQRIEKILLIEATAGILNELSSSQMQSFEAAIKRRKLFQ